LESAKECVTTHLPKQPALKMDGALESCLYRAAAAELGPDQPLCAEGYRARARLEPPPAQILVVVANTQVGSLRADVEKGSM
jgi:hypothetical protein